MEAAGPSLPVTVGDWLLFRRLSWKYHRPLVLKSPPHTGRIRRLLEVFPRARFVHVHRDPYAVFSSTRRMLPFGGGITRFVRCTLRP